MKTFVQIVGGKVHGVFTFPSLIQPNFDPSLRMVDVSGVNPKPVVGMTMIEEGGVVRFELLPEVVKEPVLKIVYTKLAFEEGRLLKEERIALRKLRDLNNEKPVIERDYDLVDFFELYDKAEDVRLDDQRLRDGLSFIGLNVLGWSAERLAEILTPNEVE